MTVSRASLAELGKGVNCPMKPDYAERARRLRAKHDLRHRRIAGAHRKRIAHECIERAVVTTGNTGNRKAYRFDYIFWEAPIDPVTSNPIGVAGLSRGFLLYTNRTRPVTSTSIDLLPKRGDATRRQHSRSAQLRGLRPEPSGSRRQRSEFPVPHRRDPMGPCRRFLEQVGIWV
jgi:hypothetical protein